ncbi:Folylpolyglutamate synthetase [Pseudocyphellaria aurata]|nr:Folylpolyglutamate synthetase [Pseudocyphellaria aurata]
MVEWCRKIGYEPSDFDRLRPIHIAGTKGKGSTSAFISSILAQYLPSPSQSIPRLHRIGLYTSPHLRYVRERIQINNQPLSEESFAKYFFEVWDRLEDAARAKGLPTDTSAKPMYFRYLTLMAYHTYMSEGIDTAIIECGVGGEYDCTNVLVTPSVTGITRLGIDHVVMLGNTIEEIAWHKAGIMKPGVPAFTVPQAAPAHEVLEQRAASKSTTVRTVHTDLSLSNIPLGLAADFQLSNASLAVQIVSTHLLALGHPPPLPTSPLPAEFIRGLREVRWPGRCEIRRERNLSWHIDSGHTLESIQAAATWFASQLPDPALVSSRRCTRVLFFNQQTRDADALARALHRTLAEALHDDRPFSHAVFCSNVTFQETGFRPDLVSINADLQAVGDLVVQKRLAETWRGIDATTEIKVVRSIEEAVGWVRAIAGELDGKMSNESGGVQVLVTGSVHLVGGFLEVLESGVDGEKD